MASAINDNVISYHHQTFISALVSRRGELGAALRGGLLAAKYHNNCEAAYDACNKWREAGWRDFLCNEIFACSAPPGGGK